MNIQKSTPEQEQKLLDSGLELLSRENGPLCLHVMGQNLATALWLAGKHRQTELRNASATIAELRTEKADLIRALRRIRETVDDVPIDDPTAY